MHPELMGSPGVWREFDAGTVRFTGKDSPISDCRSPVFVVDDLIRAIVDIGAERFIDCAALTRDLTIQQSNVRFLNLPRFELHGDCALRLWIERDDEEP